MTVCPFTHIYGTCPIQNSRFHRISSGTCVCARWRAKGMLEHMRLLPLSASTTTSSRMHRIHQQEDTEPRQHVYISSQLHQKVAMTTKEVQRVQGSEFSFIRRPVFVSFVERWSSSSLQHYISTTLNTMVSRLHLASAHVQGGD